MALLAFLLFLVQSLLLVNIMMGCQPNCLYYPPPNKRGHTGTGMSDEETSSQDSLSSESESEFRLQRKVKATSISEKFSLLSRTPSKESNRILQTKVCYSMHIVRGKIAKAMKVKERQRRDPTYRPPINRESPFSSASPSPDLKLVPRSASMDQRFPARHVR